MIFWRFLSNSSLTTWSSSNILGLFFSLLRVLISNVRRSSVAMGARFSSLVEWSLCSTSLRAWACVPERKVKLISSRSKDDTCSSCFSLIPDERCASFDWDSYTDVVEEARGDWTTGVCKSGAATTGGQSSNPVITRRWQHVIINSLGKRSVIFYYNSLHETGLELHASKRATTVPTTQNELKLGRNLLEILNDSWNNWYHLLHGSCLEKCWKE